MGEMTYGDHETLRRSCAAPRVAFASLVFLTSVLAVGTSTSESGASTNPAVADLQIRNVSEAILSGDASGLVTAQIHNSGLVDATNVTVDYNLPPDISAAEDGTSENCAIIARDRVTCGVGNLGAGNSVDISIGVTVDVGVAPGDRTAAFSPVVSDEFNPTSGELRFRTWFHESDGQGASPLDCWKVTNPSPNMDIIGGGEGASSLCGGNNDHPALTPDSEVYLSEFPDPISDFVGYSWEIFTSVTAPAGALYTVCAYDIDDGAYLAMAPAGEPMDNNSVKFVASIFGSSQSAPFALDSNTTYDVLLRIQNRGQPGLDNGGDGLGGFGEVGIVEGSSCTGEASNIFGTGPSSWTNTAESVITVSPTTDLAITGSITSSDDDGSSVSLARLENLGPNPVTPITEFSLVDAQLSGSGAVGCIIEAGSAIASCASETLDGGESTTVAMNFSVDSVTEREGGWNALSTDALDSNPTNNFAPGW